MGATAAAEGVGAAAAAERAVPVRAELLAQIEGQGARLTHGAAQTVALRRQRLNDLARALPRQEDLLATPRQRLDHLAERLPAALRAATSGKRLRLSEVSGGLRPGLLRRMIEAERRHLAERAARLRPRDLEMLVVRGQERLDHGLRRLSDLATRRESERTAKLRSLDQLLQTLGYEATLNRGYAVVRGDVNSIRIGNQVNIQDGAVLHCTFEKTTLSIGNSVSIGHNALVHGCTIEDHVLVGMGAIVMDHCHIASNCIIAAGAVLLEGTHVEAWSVYAGVPAKKVKTLTPELFSGEVERISKNYVRYASWFKEDQQ